MKTTLGPDGFILNTTTYWMEKWYQSYKTFSIDWKKVCRAGIPQFYIRLISNIILIKKPEANKSRENYRKISPSNIKAKLLNNAQTKQRQEYIFLKCLYIIMTKSSLFLEWAVGLTFENQLAYFLVLAE